MRFVAMITFRIQIRRKRISDRNIDGDQNLNLKETVVFVSEDVRRADRNTDK
jgi:hypothetical protein